MVVVLDLDMRIASPARTWTLNTIGKLQVASGISYLCSLAVLFASSMLKSVLTLKGSHVTIQLLGGKQKILCIFKHVSSHL